MSRAKEHPEMGLKLEVTVIVRPGGHPLLLPVRAAHFGLERAPDGRPGYGVAAGPPDHHFGPGGG
jgi:hypothetical protein